MSESKRIEGLRKVLLVEGMREIENYGLKDFSVRRIASACGISCATPYRYFKDKDEYVLAIREYVHQQWILLRGQISEAFSEDLHRQIVEICVAYIRFWVANSNFMQTPDSKDAADEDFLKGISVGTRDLIEAYCKKNGISEYEKKKRVLLVRSIIIGAANMICSGLIANNDETMDMVRVCLSGAV